MNTALRGLPAEMDLVEDRNAPRAIKVGFILRCSVVLLWENLRISGSRREQQQEL
jgi:hypothetical protein